MNRAVVAAALALVAAAPSPAALVAGSVRDQDGVPIAGASIRLIGSRLRTTTDADGTFVLDGTGTRVEIRCPYCRTTDVPVAPDGTVVAVIPRYNAVRKAQPTTEDLAHLPYADVASDFSLTPFVVLTRATGPAQRVALHDASVSGPGGVLAIDGVPAYDSAGGVPLYGTIPAHDALAIQSEPGSQAFRYGNLAIGGAYAVTTTGAGAVAEAGGDDAVRAGTQSANVQSGVGYDNASDGTGSERAAAQATLGLGQTQASFAVSSGSARDTDLSGSFSSFRFALQRTSGIDAYATLTADRGTNRYDELPYAFAERWSDVAFETGVRSIAPIAPFVTFAVSETHGSYAADARPLAFDGSLGQARAYGGVSASGSWYDVTLAQGIDSIAYATSSPQGYPESAQGRDQDVAVDLHPGRWAAQYSTSAGYAIDPFVSSYIANPVSPIDAMSQQKLSLGFGDDARVRAQALLAQTRDAGGDDDVGSGWNIAWQIAPQLSVRTWWLALRTASGRHANVGSSWLTWTPGALRVDLIYRRDLLNGAPDAHLDGDLSGPIARGLSWFVESEQRFGARSTAAGIRF